MIESEVPEQNSDDTAADNSSDDKDALCVACRSTKTHFNCELCDERVCKSCTLYLEPERLSFQPDLPGELLFSRYCQVCYNQHVAPAILTYDERIEKAKGVTYLSRAFKGHIPVQKKALKWVEVRNCRDRNETILRLAFLATLQGFNSVVQAEVECEKVRNEGYQTSVWRGKAYPAQVDEAWIARQEAQERPNHRFDEN